MSRFGVAILLFCTILAVCKPGHAQEMNCQQLMVQCGDGPGQMLNQNGTLSFVGGGQISTQCVGVISGVLATYKSCHGELTWAGAAAILIHFVHENPSLLRESGWDCATAVYKNVFACQS